MDDPLQSFLSVSDAIEKAQIKGIKLGHTYQEASDHDMYGDLNKELRLAWKKVCEPRGTFSCGGWLDLDKQEAQNLQVLLKTDEGQQFQSFPWTKLPVQELFERYFKPAPFGDLVKQETRIDPEVRLASECTPGNFLLGFPKALAPQSSEASSSRKKGRSAKKARVEADANSLCPPPFLERIRHHIATTIMVGTEVELVPHKMNMYGPGGFFTPHVDTPTDTQDMVGTLVVCLPSSHVGGDLLVRQQEVEQCFEFAKHSKDVNKVQWAAFYSDCDHEVKKVEEGYRVTITYSILVKEENEKEEEDFAQVRKLQAMAAKKTLQDKESDHVQVSANPSFLPTMKAIEQLEDESFGILLSHRYTYNALQANRLKGADRFLIAELETKHTVTLMPIIVHEVLPISDDGDEGEATTDVFAFSREDLHFLEGKGPSPVHPWDDMVFFDTNSSIKVLKRSETEPENQGNWVEAGERDTLYFSCAAIVDIAHEDEEDEPATIFIHSSPEIV